MCTVNSGGKLFNLLPLPLGPAYLGLREDGRSFDLSPILHLSIIHSQTRIFFLIQKYFRE